MSIASIVDSVRQPEYTGENRCTPCTIANSVIAVVVSAALVGGALWGGLGAPVAGGLGVAVLGVSAASIWLRGYLVPGTPELTKQYFPDWVLAKFDKLPEEDEATPFESDLEPEVALQEAGALELCADRDDLCLTGSFEATWTAEMEAIDESNIDPQEILAALNAREDFEDAGLNTFGEAVILEHEGRELGKWESTAALVADLGAARALAREYDRWDSLGPFDRSRLARGLRIFLEECPICGGPITLGQDTVESCCRSYEVVAVSCESCDSRLFEERWEGAAEGAQAGA